MLEFKNTPCINFSKEALGGLQQDAYNSFTFNMMRNNLNLVLLKNEFKKQKEWIVNEWEPLFKDETVICKMEKDFSSILKGINEP